jgi:hypothetical protein
MRLLPRLLLSLLHLLLLRRPQALCRCRSSMPWRCC